MLSWIEWWKWDASIGLTGERRTFHDINTPTLVMVGAHDLPDLIESAHYLAYRLSEQPSVVNEDAAHLPSLEQWEAFNAALLAFLDS